MRYPDSSDLLPIPLVSGLNCTWKHIGKAILRQRYMVDRARELRAGLARKIALYMGSAENRATELPGVTLHRRTAPTAPCSATCEPGVTVIAQGRKRVDLGGTT